MFTKRNIGMKSDKELVSRVASITNKPSSEGDFLIKTEGSLFILKIMNKRGGLLTIGRFKSIEEALKYIICQYRFDTLEDYHVFLDNGESTSLINIKDYISDKEIKNC